MEYRDNGTVVEAYRPKFCGDIQREIFAVQPLGSGSACLIRTKVFDDVEYFDEEINRGVDSDFLRWLARQHYVDFVPAILTKYTVGHGLGRITDENETNIMEATQSHARTLQKHRDTFRSHPD
jgi:GT2 family glycosyltransferase